MASNSLLVAFSASSLRKSCIRKGVVYFRDPLHIHSMLRLAHHVGYVAYVIRKDFSSVSMKK
jgi:hypothetical protein